MVLKWLQSVCTWLLNSIFLLLPVTSGSKRDHDSDYDSSDEDSFRGTCASANGVFDAVDHVANPLKPREVLQSDTQPAPKRTLTKKGEIHLKNPYCVVIVNINFENRLGPRNGAQADRENIERLLTQSAGYKSVHVFCDQKRTDILETIDGISNSAEMANHDGLMVFISSHGKAKGILAADKKIVEVDELTARVNGKKCKALRGKPKLFFIAACRGKKSDGGAPGLIDHDSDEDERLIPRLPTDADFLVCYSTTKDYLSYRRFALGIQNTSDMGTWFISSLTHVFKERMKSEDVMQMLARVNTRVAKMATSDDHVNGMKQMPVQMHMLRHRVFLG